MTILVSSVSTGIIVMLSDSAVTDTHEQEEGDSFYTYRTDSKYFIFQGVGCITTWGERTHNKIGNYLFKQKISPKTHTVGSLAELTYKYICDEYSKENELGFHIGGFDKTTGRPCLYHVFWGIDQSNPEQKEPAAYRKDHSDWIFLYNGRNDLAHTIISTLQKQIKSKKEIRFDLTTPLGNISLCDFIARFAAEITPQVGPPFMINLIFPDNSIEKVENTSYSPISLQSMTSVIQKLLPVTKVSQNEGQPFPVPGTLQTTPSGGGPPTGTPREEEIQTGDEIHILHREKKAR